MYPSNQKKTSKITLELPFPDTADNLQNEDEQRKALLTKATFIENSIVMKSSHGTLLLSQKVIKFQSSHYKCISRKTIKTLLPIRKVDSTRISKANRK